MSDYLTPQDFKDIGYYNLYLAALFAKALNPKVDVEYAEECLEGFLIYFAENDGSVPAEDIVSLAEEIMEGPRAPGEMH